MHESLLRQALVFLVALGVCACDDPGAPFPPGGGGTRPPPIGTGGTGGSGAAGGDGGAGGVAGSAGGAGMGGSPGTGGSAGTGGEAGVGGASGAGGIGSLGACDNLNDRMVLGALEPDPSEARRISAFCGVAVCSGVDEATCVDRATTCVENRISDLSTECAACYGQLAWCAGNACNAVCNLDPCGDCLTCGGGDYAGCQEDLGDCAGFVPPECSPT